MQWSDVSSAPSTRTLRQFAGLLMVVLGGFAAWQGLVHDHAGLATGLASIAAIMGLVGVVWPKAIRPIFVVWMAVAFPIGWTVSHVLLALVFYALFAPLGLVFRLIGRDRLRRRRPRKLATYWVSKPQAPATRQYLRQF